jgi:NADPH:quinone reductase-like Zn-dependent oxidoreductase
MLAVVATNYVGDDFSSLVPTKIPVPSLAEDGQVLIRIASAAVNPIDWKVIANSKLNGTFPIVFPQKLGCDVAGTVVACQGCTRLKVGDIVWSDLGAGHTEGAFAEYAMANESGVGLKPKALSFNDAATLPLVSKTMYQAIELASPGKTNPPSLEGKDVLITSGSGGTGFVGIQVRLYCLGIKLACTRLCYFQTHVTLAHTCGQKSSGHTRME